MFEVSCRQWVVSVITVDRELARRKAEQRKEVVVFQTLLWAW